MRQDKIDAKRDLMLTQVKEDSPARLSKFIRAYKGKGNNGRKQAIEAKCLECCWMDSRAVKDCLAPECPLWNFRPYQDTYGSDSDSVESVRI